MNKYCIKKIYNNNRRNYDVGTMLKYKAHVWTVVRDVVKSSIDVYYRIFVDLIAKDIRAFSGQPELNRVHK